MATRPGTAPNPFVYGRVLRLEDAACARPAYDAAILNAVRDRGRLALAGDRRLGKSTLIERTHQAKGLPLLRWDFHKVLSLDDLVRRAAEDLDAFVRDLSPVARRVTPWLREVGLGIEDIRLTFHGVGAALSVRAPTDHLKRLLGYLAQIAGRRPFSLFIDELQDLRDELPDKEGDAVLGLLRAELQRVRIPCFFAGSSRDSFRRLFMSESSPFFESARLLEVDPIPSGDFSAFLRRQFESGGFELSPEAADVLLAIGGESPNDVQHLAHETWNVAVRKQVGGAELKLALDKILNDYTPMGEAWLAGGAAVVGALKPCVQSREPIVEKVASRYRVRSRYLRLWLCTRRHLVQEMIPALRSDEAYQSALRRVCRQLPDDLVAPP